MKPLDQRPSVGPERPFTPTRPEVDSRGWRLYRPTLPLVSLRVLIPGGRLNETSPGLTCLADRLLMRGAGARNADAFSGLLEQNAISLSVSTGATATTVSLSCHTRQLELGTELLRDLLHEPHFADNEVNRERTLTLGDIAQAQDEPEHLAREEAARRFHTGPLATPRLGTEESLAALGAEELRASWQQRRREALIVAAGAIEALPDLGLPLARPRPLRAADPACSGRFEVPRPDAPQSVVRVLFGGWACDDQELPAARMAALALGGTFTSRLNTLLREEKGWTYGARLWVEPALGRAAFQTSVVAEHTRETVDLLREQLELARREGLTEAERIKAIAAHRTRVVSAQQTVGSTSSALAELALQGRTVDDLALELASPPSLEQLNAALNRLDLDRAVLVLVGDPEQTRETR